MKADILKEEAGKKRAAAVVLRKEQSKKAHKTKDLNEGILKGEAMQPDVTETGEGKDEADAPLRTFKRKVTFKLRQ